MPATTVEALIKQKTPKVLAELSGDPSEWSVVYAFFARAGFTSGAQKAAATVGATLVDLARLDAESGRGVEIASDRRTGRPAIPALRREAAHGEGDLRHSGHFADGAVQVPGTSGARWGDGT